MRYITEPACLEKLASVDQRAHTLMILLPGAYQQPEDFIREGFVAAVRKRKLNIDLVLAELPISQIADLSALMPIHEELVTAARQAGYQSIWLGGISIGGYMALAYADHYPAQLGGLLLLAPYPGNRATTGEVAAAGGIHAWLPDTIADDDTERRNLQWLKTHGQSSVPIYMGYGSEDRFADAHAMMAAALPAAQVDRITGDHSWPVWLALWQRFLDRHASDLTASRTTA